MERSAQMIAQEIVYVEDGKSELLDTQVGALALLYAHDDWGVESIYFRVCGIGLFKRRPCMAGKIQYFAVLYFLEWGRCGSLMIGWMSLHPHKGFSPVVQSKMLVYCQR